MGKTGTAVVVQAVTNAEEIGNSSIINTKASRQNLEAFSIWNLFMPASLAKVSQRKQRWLDFLDLSSSTRFVYLLRYAPELGVKPWPNPELKQPRIEWIWQNYKYHIQRMDWLEDDILPCLDMITGTDIFAEAFGCKIFRPEDNMPFALPFVTSARQAAQVNIPSLDTPSLALVFEMADELRRRAGPEVLFRLVDIQSPMDIAALIWEKQYFYTALIEAPEAVLELVMKVRTLLMSFLDEWFRRYGREFIAHYPDYYLPHGISLSEDEIGAVSSRMFNQYFLPELVEISDRYGGLGIHCCANSRHQWESFHKIPNLRLLNINQPEPIVREAYPYFAIDVPQWHYGWDPGASPKEWLAQLPPQAHVVIDITAESKEQAIYLSERLTQLRNLL